MAKAWPAKNCTALTSGIFKQHSLHPAIPVAPTLGCKGEGGEPAGELWGWLQPCQP